MNDLVKAYFNLTNNEQRGIISLTLIILFVFIGPRLYLHLQPAEEVPNDNTHVLALWSHTKKNSAQVKEKIIKKEIALFPFDPNTVSREELIQLGLKESVTSTLINYRNKGGHFYQAQDLLKVYGISEDEFHRLEPLINIVKPIQNKYPKWENESASPISQKTFETQLKEEVTFIPLDLNTADSAQLTTVKGIGPVYASRIIKYRKLLRGFLEKTQLTEVYGIDQEVYAKISSQVIVDPLIHPIKVYEASWYDLKSHPYISGDLANIILNYRKAHGELSDLNILLENQLIDEETFFKINPYLSFQK